MFSIRTIIKSLLFLPYSIYYLFKKDVVYLNVSVHKSVLLNKGHNWGDDLNYVFIRQIIGECCGIYNWSLFSKILDVDNYLCIGSIIESRCNSNSIVWGSGCISYDKPFIKPKKVLAVRGPLTRKRLLDAGVYCPEIYGDPALLLPQYYTPKSNKKYKIGIIPHYVDKSCKAISIAKSMNVKIIDIQNYGDFTSVVEQVNECEFVFSSSLHGIIVSDAYGIPNAWVEFSNNIVGNRFKFYDYFLSVARNVDAPIIINDEYDIENILSMRMKYIKPVIDLQNLKDCCPFKLLDVKF